MKVKFNVAHGSSVSTYKNDNATIDEAMELMQRDEVISISVVKQTPAQYLKTLREFDVNRRGYKYHVKSV